MQTIIYYLYTNILHINVFYRVPFLLESNWDLTMNLKSDDFNEISYK